jgi:hypothetical protein
VFIEKKALRFFKGRFKEVSEERVVLRKVFVGSR